MIRRPPRRGHFALLLLSMLGLGLAADLAASLPLNPFLAPPPFALGSGQAGGGAHCASPLGS